MSQQMYFPNMGHINILAESLLVKGQSDRISLDSTVLSLYSLESHKRGWLHFRGVSTDEYRKPTYEPLLWFALPKPSAGQEYWAWVVLEAVPSMTWFLWQPTAAPWGSSLHSQPEDRQAKGPYFICHGWSQFLETHLPCGWPVCQQIERPMKVCRQQVH